MNVAVCSAFASVLLYRTSLWASVATKAISSLLSSQNTPDITGLNSSFPAANKVLLNAFLKTSELKVIVVASSMVGLTGNSSLLWPVSLNLPSPAEISIARVSLSMLIVIGTSANVFNVSNNSLAGMVTNPGSSAISNCTLTDIVVSRSEAVIVNVFSFNSNKKSSRIGRVLLGFITPLIICRFLNSTELDTINFILVFYLEN